MEQTSRIYAERENALLERAETLLLGELERFVSFDDISILLCDPFHLPTDATGIKNFTAAILRFHRIKKDIEEVSSDHPGIREVTKIIDPLKSHISDHIQKLEKEITQFTEWKNNKKLVEEDIDSSTLFDRDQLMFCFTDKTISTANPHLLDSAYTFVPGYIAQVSEVKKWLQDFFITNADFTSLATFLNSLGKYYLGIESSSALEPQS